MNIVSFNQLISLDASTKIKTDESKIKKIVCVHWINRQCKKGEDCEFLHRWDTERLPVCRYWFKEGHCLKGEDCVYRHSAPEKDRR